MPSALCPQRTTPSKTTFILEDAPLSPKEIRRHQPRKRSESERRRVERGGRREEMRGLELVTDLGFGCGAIAFAKFSYKIQNYIC